MLGFVLSAWEEFVIADRFCVASATCLMIERTVGTLPPPFVLPNCMPIDEDDI